MRPVFGEYNTPSKPFMENLISEIRRDARETRHYTGREHLKESVLDAMRRVDRSRFVAPGTEIYAWENRPLPIGYGQTISQPFIVALMTDLLDLTPEHRVLELGTGSCEGRALEQDLQTEEEVVGLHARVPPHFQPDLPHPPQGVQADLIFGDPADLESHAHLMHRARLPAIAGRDPTPPAGARSRPPAPGRAPRPARRDRRAAR